MVLNGKKGVIMGVANDHSIGWGIAKQLHAHGAQLAFTYQNDSILKRITPLAKQVNSDICVQCDVSEGDAIKNSLQEIHKKLGDFDFIVHSLAYSDKDELNGRISNTSRKNFAQSMDISVYSFIETAREAAKYMPNGGNMITLTYEGARRVMNHYNVMGVAKAALEASVKYLAVDFGAQNIRINAISAGPMRTLAGSAIGGARFTYNWQGGNAPMKRNVTLDDIGGAAVYLLSDLSDGVTGEVHFVDGGYHVVGMLTV